MYLKRSKQWLIGEPADKKQQKYVNELNISRERFRDRAHAWHSNTAVIGSAIMFVSVIVVFGILFSEVKLFMLIPTVTFLVGVALLFVPFYNNRRWGEKWSDYTASSAYSNLYKAVGQNRLFDVSSGMFVEFDSALRRVLPPEHTFTDQDYVTYKSVIDRYLSDEKVLKIDGFLNGERSDATVAETKIRHRRLKETLSSIADDYAGEIRDDKTKIAQTWVDEVDASGVLPEDQTPEKPPLELTSA